MNITARTGNTNLAKMSFAGFFAHTASVYFVFSDMNRINSMQEYIFRTAVQSRQIVRRRRDIFAIAVLVQASSSINNTKWHAE